MKTVALLLVFGLVGFVRSADFPCPNRDVRSITFGSDNPDARLVMTEKVKTGMEPNRVVSAYAQYPRKGDRSKGWITKVEIEDLSSNGKGGCAKITDGGVGNTKLSVAFQSQSKGLGINYVVRVWAISDITNAV